MKEELLFQKIASSANPLREINALRNETDIKFIEYLNRISGGLVQRNNLQESYKINGWSLQISRNIRNPLMEAHVLFNQAQLERMLGKINAAEQTFRDALKLYEKYGSAVDILDGTAGLLEILSANDKRKEIEKVAEHTLNKVLENSDQFSGAIKDSLLKICSTLRRQGESRPVKTYLNILLQLGEQFGDRESEVEACGMLAETLVDDDPKEAQKLFHRALELDRLDKNAKMQAIDLANLGWVSFRLSELEMAYQYFAECIAIRERENFNSGIADDLYHFYHVCHYVGKRAQALQLFTKWMELTTGTPAGFRMTPVSYHIQLDECGNKKEGIELGRP